MHLCPEKDQLSLKIATISLQKAKFPTRLQISHQNEIPKFLISPRHDCHYIVNTEIVNSHWLHWHGVLWLKVMMIIIIISVWQQNKSEIFWPSFYIGYNMEYRKVVIFSVFLQYWDTVKIFFGARLKINNNIYKQNVLNYRLLPTIIHTYSPGHNPSNLWKAACSI